MAIFNCYVSSPEGIIPLFTVLMLPLVPNWCSISFAAWQPEFSTFQLDLFHGRVIILGYPLVNIQKAIENGHL